MCHVHKELGDCKYTGPSITRRDLESIQAHNLEREGSNPSSATMQACSSTSIEPHHSRWAMRQGRQACTDL